MVYVETKNVGRVRMDLMIAPKPLIHLQLFYSFEESLQRWVSWSPVEALLNHSEVDAKISQLSWKKVCAHFPQHKIDETVLDYDREDMAQVIQNLMSNQTTKEEILGLSCYKMEVLTDLLQDVSILIVVKIK